MHFLSKYFSEMAINPFLIGVGLLNLSSVHSCESQLAMVLNREK